jgi:outer membrane lipoprotein carrier protein
MLRAATGALLAAVVAALSLQPATYHLSPALSPLPSPLFPVPDAPTAAQIARAFQLRYASLHTLETAFLERYREGKQDVQVESGKAWFRRPGRMRWEYEAPEKKLFLVDGKHAWFYVPADRTVTRTPVKESEDWHTPIALLAGRANLSRLCGRLEFAQPPPQPGFRPPAPGSPLPAYRLRCLPRGADAPFREVLLELDANLRLLRLLMREPGGVELEFSFAGWKENHPLPEEMFRFRLPAGVAIVEDPSLAGRAP